MGGVIGDLVHHVAYARHVANVFFNVEMGVKGAGGAWWWSGCVGGDESGSDDVVGYLAEALLWSLSDF